MNRFHLTLGSFLDRIHILKYTHNTVFTQYFQNNYLIVLSVNGLCYIGGYVIRYSQVKMYDVKFDFGHGIGEGN